MTTKTQKILIAQIITDTSRFQFRTSEFCQERVDFLVANWDESILDPIDVWEAPDGRKYLLAGHHRFEAAIELGIKELLARSHKVTENVARTIALKSNANRLEYTAMEKSRCLTYLIEEEGLSKIKASEQMALNPSMGAKYYSLRHLRETKWEIQVDINPKLLSLGFIVGQNCEKMKLSSSEKDTIYDLVIEEDLSYRELNQLFRDLKDEVDQQTQTVATQEELFDLSSILTNKVVKTIKKKDKLQNLAMYTWWLYELVEKDQQHNYQVPEEIKDPLLEMLEKLYAFSVGSQQEREKPERNSIKKTKEIDQLKKSICLTN